MTRSLLIRFRVHLDRVTRQTQVSAPKRLRAHPRGFALIITMSLMILLMILAVGLLSLSTVSVRTSGREADMMTARANARMALMLAIGDLQKQLGPDQRISAPSGILASSETDAPQLAHGRLTGVWNARNEVLGRTTPDYDRQKSFRSWLVSSAEPDTLKNITFATNGTLKDQVSLARDSTNAPVQAGRIPVDDKNPGSSGRFAWWVSDENCKGFINPSSKTGTTPAVADVLASTCTPGAYGMEAVAKTFPANTPESAKVVTHGEAGLALPEGEKLPEGFFHDLSPYPRSVLCNVSKGGLRQDLSLFLEQASLDSPPAWPSASGNPTGPVGPNGKMALSDTTEYDVLSWKQLAAWSRLRKNAQITGGRPTLRAFDGTSSTPNDINNPRWNSGVLRPAPVPVRCLQFVSFGTKQVGNDANQLAVRIYIYPVIVLWNPYNVDLVTPQYNILFSSMPMRLDIKKNGSLAQQYRWIAKNGTTGVGVQPYFTQPLTLKAGECKVLSPTSWSWASGQSNHMTHVMAPVPFNYSPSFAGGEWGADGNQTTVINVTGTPSDRLEIEAVVMDFDTDGAAHDRQGGTYQTTFDLRCQHAGMNDANWSTFLWSSKLGWRYRKANDTPSPSKLANNVTPSVTFGSVKDAPRPFLVADAKLKDLEESEFPNKTWSQCIPSQAFQGVSDARGATPLFVNAYKLTYETISSYQAASTYMQVSAGDPTQSYFGGSYFPQNGQSLITDAEIPMAPLSSLAQLQNLPQSSIDNLYSSGFHFQNHAIGNSFASPGVASNAIKTRGTDFWVDKYYNENGGSISGQKFPGSQYLTRDNIDRSYAANHLLWDDYFFSSMAPKDGILTTGGKAGLDQVVRDFYQNGKPLPNERYKPYLYKPASNIVSELVSRNQASTTGYQKSAASLMVDGGFNINSVSVNAWKTLLASTHRRQMAVLNSTGGNAQVQPEGKFIVSRFTMPNGSSADASSGQAAKNLRWIGYRELTEPQIDALAHAIVRQVKTRGPFRSLGEFINRRLGSESDPLTRYGALQAALEDDSVDINQDYRSKSISTGFLQQARVTYPNQTAATGSRYQGAPAYVTQADLLGPIAPILSARSDTFVIRAYGEATGEDGKTTARAWCEAVVQRLPGYMDATDTPDLALARLRSPINQKFGRRFEVTGFRWLTAEEI